MWVRFENHWTRAGVLKSEVPRPEHQLHPRKSLLEIQIVLLTFSSSEPEVGGGGGGPASPPGDSAVALESPFGETRALSFGV